MRLLGALLTLAAAAVLFANPPGCACDPADPKTLEARSCSLTREALAQPEDPPVFFLKDINPRKPNRWLALPRAVRKDVYTLSRMRPQEREQLWTAAIAKAKSAGIRTVMITGDHQTTATAIARQLDILPPGGRVLTGADLENLDDKRLSNLVRDTYVYARVTPEHKLRIVRALQANHEVVAMTGDGVNDAPAIKQADIGIAMGQSGTDVAKEASSLILADDNYATIVAAVEEGRAIYDNIKKFIRYLLASNVGEILTMFLAMLAGWPLPLTPIQILWVNLVTDGLPAIALGVDEPEDDIMNRPPRNVHEGIFARGMAVKILSRGTLIGLATLAVFAWSLRQGADLAHAQTMAYATLTMAQLILVFDS
ncbi:MAG: cation-translocating P-type ATPase, partial [Bryobacteraceae bacterium]|nr:cation-translocating P-type ATPase [Bryobacteraceae bacterium]